MRENGLRRTGAAQEQAQRNNGTNIVDGRRSASATKRHSIFKDSTFHQLTLKLCIILLSGSGLHCPIHEILCDTEKVREENRRAVAKRRKLNPEKTKKESLEAQRRKRSTQKQLIDVTTRFLEVFGNI